MASTLSGALSGRLTKAVLLNQIRQDLTAHFEALGIPPTLGAPRTLTKDDVRRMHFPQRVEAVRKNSSLVLEEGAELIRHIAAGEEVDPFEIRPEIVPVLPGSEESKVFRFAALSWSVPVSAGYGRRMRILVRDRQNGKLIGLIGLTDPVFNLRARDQWVGWTAEDRRHRLRSVMDGCVLGALPPYSFLLGGKLTAALSASSEIRDMFHERYRGIRSVILNRRASLRLAMLTTTSALGPSSMYDRLRLPRGLRFEAVGYTEGFGRFHFPDQTFTLMRRYLRLIHHPYADGFKFGAGPNWRMRVIRVCLEHAGLDPSLLRHGIPRQVYVVPLATNAREFLRGEDRCLRDVRITAAGISRMIKRRWMIPRSERDDCYKSYAPATLLEELKQLAAIKA